MINVLDSVKELYKSDSVTKKYFLVFRDYGQMKDNSDIQSESLRITESICSSGNFKVGLCESGSCKLSVVLSDNIKNDEVAVFQVLGDFEPTITNPPINRDATGNLILSSDTEGIQLSGEGLTKLTTTFESYNIIDGLDSSNFSKEENYLVLAKLKYIGNPIYLYVETSAGISRMVYYLKSGLFNFSNLEEWDSIETYNESVMVMHDGFVWESKTYGNTIEPSEETNAWQNITRYIQIAIPLVGSEFYEYKKGIYVNDGQEYGTLEGTASIYKLDYPIMPLGLFTVKSCKRMNDGKIRNLECYDRMGDVGLDVDMYFSGSTNIQMGQILDQAASGTQIVIGNNLSKQPIYPDLISEEDATLSDFPTGDIYQTDKTEVQLVQGIYSEIQSSNCTLDHTRIEQKTLNGTYVNGGNYSHTQMQIIDGTLDETATSSNKEFSTNLRKTIKSDNLIDSDNSNWSAYANAGKLRSIGTRRQKQTLTGTLIDSDNSNWTTANINAGKVRSKGTRRQTKQFTGTLIDSSNSNWTTANINNGKLIVGSGKRRLTTTQGDTRVSTRTYVISGTYSGYAEQYIDGEYSGTVEWNDLPFYGEYPNEGDWWEDAGDGMTEHIYQWITSDTSHWPGWTVTKNWSHNNSSTVTVGGRVYTLLSYGPVTEKITGGTSMTQTKTETRTDTFKNDDLSYGWYYSSYDKNTWTNDGQTLSGDSGWRTNTGGVIANVAKINTHRDTSYGYYYSSWDTSKWTLFSGENYSGQTNSGWVDKNNSSTVIYSKATIVVYRDTNYGYVYNNLPGWIIQNAEYYTGISDSSWVTTSDAKIKSAAYIDLYKTLYWKYNWDSLATKTANDTNWVAYGSDTTFQYQSLSSGSGAQYSLASARPASGNWYTQLNTIYSDVAVYKKMSRRYTRTHYFDYTFTDAGAGWARYKNSTSDDYYNYVNDTSSGNRQYMGVTLADQYRVGTYSDVTVYNSLGRDYRKTIAYGYIFNSPEGTEWIHPNEDYNTSSDTLKYRANTTVGGITQLTDVYNTLWRAYERNITYTWSETATLKKMTYEIPLDIYDSSMAYTVYITYPTDSIAYQQENNVRELALAQAETFTDEETNYTSYGTLIIDRQSAVRNSIFNNSTKVAVVGNDRKFYIYWVQTLTYTGYISYNNGAPVENYQGSGIIRAANPYQSCVMHSTVEKFNSMPIEWGSASIHGTRRSVIAGFMEIHGLFINFDRWGVSTTRNVSSSTLYPAENLYPHDSTIPGLEQYGDIYPSIGSTEVTDVSICRSIYIDDDLNNEFDGVVIVKSQVSQSEAGLYPFYYNRLTKRYGALPSGMPEISTTPWEGNNYYRIENNFFFDNFIFTRDQLKEICKQILSNIGELQYFNLTAKLRALPYMEVGDSIDIMTPDNGYETAILRRVMSGCLAQMDSIETDFD